LKIGKTFTIKPANLPRVLLLLVCPFKSCHHAPVTCTRDLAAAVFFAKPQIFTLTHFPCCLLLVCNFLTTMKFSQKQKQQQWLC